MGGPLIYSVRDWGGVVVDTSRLARAKMQGIVIHHTASANRNVSEIGVVERGICFDLARNIQDHHRQGNGWKDSGHHFLVSRSGIIMEGRKGSYCAAQDGLVIQGAHAGNNKINRTWIGIECEGLYTEVEPPVALWRSLVSLCAWLSFVGETQSSAIEGHRHWKATQCPGDRMAARLDQLRAETREVKLKLMEAAGQTP